MKETSLAFDHRPDPVLGAALREALAGANHSSFVARVTAALAVPPHELHWDVLASWARRGIAAACVAAIGIGLIMAAVPLSAPMDLIASVSGPTASEIVATVGPPEPGVALAPVGER